MFWVAGSTFLKNTRKSQRSHETTIHATSPESPGSPISTLYGIVGSESIEYAAL